MAARETKMAKEVFQVFIFSSRVVPGRESFLTTALPMPKSNTADREIKDARKR